MIDWYYHAPGEGRVGPFSADELRKRFHDGLLRHDTLVWHAGLREWQPLERLAAELGIAGIQPQPAMPPPMPTGTPPPLRMQAAPAAARGKYARTPLAHRRKTLSSGAIALLVGALIGIPGLMIAGSIVLPAYRDYARQAANAGAVEGLSNGLKRAVEDYVQQTGACPSNEDPGLGRMRREIRSRFAMDLRFASIDDGCAFEVAIAAGQAAGGKWLRYEGRRHGNAFEWDCSGGDMPDAQRPHECRAGG